MVIHCYDHASWTRTLALPLDAELHALLTARLRSIEAEGLLDMTDLVVVAAETTDAELVGALGWTWRVDPDGHRVGEPAYITPFDLAYRASTTFHVAVQIVGNAGAAVEYIVHDQADPALVSLCRDQAA